MKKYQFQILQYFPDLVTGEFVNVGIVLYSQEANILYSRFITRYKRISDFFPGINGKKLISFLRNVEFNTSRIFEQIDKEFDFVKYSDIQYITRNILPVDDSALQFSEVKNGITLNFELTIEDLFETFVNKYENQYIRKSRSDEDAEQIIYREYFGKYGISSKLKKKTVTTNNDTFDFDGWKNGVWHCYKPVSFDLIEDASIKEKVYKWSGITNELLTSKEEFRLFILALKPSHSETQNNLLEFIHKKLEINDPKHFIKVITEDEFESFTHQVQEEITLH
jgi:hypothetical protein